MESQTWAIGDTISLPDELARQTPPIADEALEHFRQLLATADADRRRAECSARIQSGVVQLALNLAVRELDIAEFFRVFIKTLVEEVESQACGVWLIDEPHERCDLWMAYVRDHFVTKESHEWESLTLPRASMAAHLYAYTPGWAETIEYQVDDERLPQAVRDFNRASGIESFVTAPLVLPTRTLGWIVLSTAQAPSSCEGIWRRTLVEAVARQVTLALHQSQLAEQNRQEERRQAVLQERNRIARDIHDTLAQGFAAILMQLQAAQRSAATLPAPVAKILDTAVDLARTHMIEARRSVSALRPQHTQKSEDVAAALERMTQLAARTTDVPIELTVEDLPPLGGDVEREIIGVAQEALTNAVRHSSAHRISVHAAGVRSLGFRLSIADDGRGIPKERRGAGFGMISMQERAERIGASLTIITAPRSGTEVVLAWEPASFSIPRVAHAAV